MRILLTVTSFLVLTACTLATMGVRWNVAERDPGHAQMGGEEPQGMALGKISIRAGVSVTLALKHGHGEATKP